MKTQETADESDGALRFLLTKRTPEELKTALEILEEFKQQENQAEWYHTPFDCWMKLEQMEDYLRLLTGDGAEDVKDETAKKYLAHREASP